uniref:CULLIN_2 domain-containing protein n=1 Tax=Strongyloides papillosus TaxID=174720 RepID=A0A0N5CB80_STREA
MYFIGALEEGFSEVVKENSVVIKSGNKAKSAGFLAKYRDSILTKNSKVSDSDIKTLIADLMPIFEFINEKYVFYNFYARYYAKCLINNKSVGEEYKIGFINHLKHHCGFGFSTKLINMNGDVVASKDITRNFCKHLVYQPFKTSLWIWFFY